MRITLFLLINTYPAERYSRNFPPALSIREAAVHNVLKLVSYAVLVLMASAVGPKVELPMVLKLIVPRPD